MMNEEQASSGEENVSVVSIDYFAQLNDNQKKFVTLYCEYGNASRAARDAGYENRPNTAGYQLMTNNVISAAIAQKMEQSVMSVGECLGRMTTWGRGSLAYFINETGEIDLTSEDAVANYGTLKKLKQKKTVHFSLDGAKTEETQTEIEIHDPKDSIFKLMQIRGKVIEKHEHSGPNGGPIDWKTASTVLIVDQTNGNRPPAPDEEYEYTPKNR